MVNAKCSAISLCLCVVILSDRLPGAEDLLPDITTPGIYLSDWQLIPGDPLSPGDPKRKILRLSNGTANLGQGELRLIGQVLANDDGTLDVDQIITRSDGSTWSRFVIPR